MLKVGEAVLLDDRIFLVDMVNRSRARLIPLSVTPKQVKFDQQTREIKSAGKAIDVSPDSLIPRIDLARLTEDELRRKEKHESMTKGASAIPVMEKPQRRGKGVARKTTKKTATKEKTGTCTCGCGKSTGGWFAPGHDSKFHGWLKKLQTGEATRKDFDKKTQAALAKYQWRKYGDGIVPTKDYKGEPYTPHPVPRRKNG